MHSLSLPPVHLQSQRLQFVFSEVGTRQSGSAPRSLRSLQRHGLVLRIVVVFAFRRGQATLEVFVFIQIRYVHQIFLRGHFFLFLLKAKRTETSWNCFFVIVLLQSLLNRAQQTGEWNFSATARRVFSHDSMSCKGLRHTVHKISHIYRRSSIEIVLKGK